METKFVKHKQPCPLCNSSDAVSVNENGSAKCFSCNSFIPNYDRPMQTQPVSVVSSQPKIESVELSFNALTDRGISRDTAVKYGVKSEMFAGKIVKQKESVMLWQFTKCSKVTGLWFH